MSQQTCVIKYTSFTSIYPHKHTHTCIQGHKSKVMAKWKHVYASVCVWQTIRKKEGTKKEKLKKRNSTNTETYSVCNLIYYYYSYAHPHIYYILQFLYTHTHSYMDVCIDTDTDLMPQKLLMYAISTMADIRFCHREMRRKVIGKLLTSQSTETPFQYFPFFFYFYKACLFCEKTVCLNEHGIYKRHLGEFLNFQYL